MAVAALARAAAYAEWRGRPEGEVPSLADIDPDAARAVVNKSLLMQPEGGLLPTSEATRLFAAYGVTVWPLVVVNSVSEALAGAAEVGYPVALKATAEPLRHRPELGTVSLDIAGEDELRTAYQAMTTRLDVATAALAVQSMAPAGVPTVAQTAEDASFGALMSFGSAEWPRTSSATSLPGAAADRYRRHRVGQKRARSTPAVRIPRQRASRCPRP